MTYVASIFWKMLAASAGAGAVFVAQWLEDRGGPRPARVAWVVAALAGVLVFFNFGAVRHGHDLMYANQYEHFHYQLGAKYFPELGYDGLYLASFLAERQARPGEPMQREIRDLETNQLRTLAVRDPALRAVRERFDTARWRAFRRDHAYYQRSMEARVLASARKDHGFNPSPAWTFVARLFAAWPESSRRLTIALANLDVGLMVLAFFVVFRSFGARTAFFSIALFGLTYGTRYTMQGGFLRLDWLAAVLFGVSALATRRAGLAGAAFGYATAARLFPAVFFVGALAAMLAGRIRGQPTPGTGRYVQAFAAALLVAFVAGSATGRGVEAWGEFAENMLLHRDAFAVTRIGLGVLVEQGPEAVADAIERGGLPSPRLPSSEEIHARGAERLGASLAAKVVLLLLLSAALWRAAPWQGAVLGLVALFTLTNAGSYYWIALCAAPLGRPPWQAVAALAIAPFLYALQYFAYIGGGTVHVRYIWASLAVGAVLVAWVLPDFWRVVRDRRRSLQSAASGALPSSSAGSA